MNYNTSNPTAKKNMENDRKHLKPVVQISYNLWSKQVNLSLTTWQQLNLIEWPDDINSHRSHSLGAPFSFNLHEEIRCGFKILNWKEEERKSREKWNWGRKKGRGSNMITNRNLVGRCFYQKNLVGRYSMLQLTTKSLPVQVMLAIRNRGNKNIAEALSCSHLSRSTLCSNSPWHSCLSKFLLSKKKKGKVVYHYLKYHFLTIAFRSHFSVVPFS